MNIVWVVNLVMAVVVVTGIVGSLAWSIVRGATPPAARQRAPRTRRAAAAAERRMTGWAA
jgi:hypothetical protein